MRLYNSSVYLACLPLLGHALSTRQDDDSDDDNTRDPFRKRAEQSLAVLGNHLYIEGGFISNWFNGEQQGTTDVARLSSTQVISLSESWTNSSVEIALVKKSTPESLKRPYFWADDSASLLYRFGGARIENARVEVDNATLWRFEPRDNEGQWSEQSPSNADVFEEIYASAGAATAACGGKGLAAGGHVYRATDARLDRNVVPSPGMLTYDFVSRAWSNETTEPVHSPSGTFNLASGLCVPDLAPDPLFLILGGADTTAESHKVKELRSFRNITFYDPVEGTWHWQEATGDVPGGRDLTCAAGVQGSDGTYEIFLHGGRHPVDGTLSDIFILSLPGFQWFRVEGHRSSPRHSLGCASVGGGQVVVSGGIGDGNWSDPDPWRHSLGVFDMSALAWSDGFDTDKEYQTPQVIRDWYDEGGLDDVTWTDDNVRAMFVNGSDTSPPDEEEEDTSSSGTPVGAIAGGVVGGVAAIAIIGGLVWFFLRKRRGQHDNYSTTGATDTPGSFEGAGRKPSPGQYSELHGEHSPAPVELEQRQYHQELDSNPRTIPSELPTEANERW